MEIVVSRENLLAGLGAIGRSVSPRSTLPVLGCVQIKTEGENSLSLQATNLSHCTYARIAAHVKETGGICVPAKTLNDLVSALPNMPITLKTRDSDAELVLFCGGNVAKIKGIPDDEFPLTALPAEGKLTVSLLARFDAGVLTRALTRTVFCAEADHTRPILGGVNFLIQRGKAVLAATDGFRLAEVIIDCQSVVDTSVVVPAETLNEVIRLAKNSDSIGLFAHAENAVIFDLGNVQIQAQLIDGRFPDYTPIMPKKFSTRGSVNYADLLGACRLMKVFVQNSVKIDFSAGVPEDGNLLFSVDGRETGSSNACVPCAIQGNPLKIEMNLSFLLDGILAMGVGDVILEMTEPMSPIVMKLQGDDTYIYLIMPMHPGKN